MDDNVKAFQAMQFQDFVWVLGSDDKLWLEQGPFGTVPPSRQQVDANVNAIQGLDIQHAVVLDYSFTLWLDQAPFSKRPRQSPNRRAKR